MSKNIYSPSIMWLVSWEQECRQYTKRVHNHLGNENGQILIILVSFPVALFQLCNADGKANKEEYQQDDSADDKVSLDFWPNTQNSPDYNKHLKFHRDHIRRHVEFTRRKISNLRRGLREQYLKQSSIWHPVGRRVRCFWWCSQRWIHRSCCHGTVRERFARLSLRIRPFFFFFFFFFYIWYIIRSKTSKKTRSILDSKKQMLEKIEIFFLRLRIFWFRFFPPIYTFIWIFRAYRNNFFAFFFSNMEA